MVSFPAKDIEAQVGGWSPRRARRNFRMNVFVEAVLFVPRISVYKTGAHWVGLPHL